MRQEVTDLRILAGELKGRKILSIKNRASHPMGSRERLALFNAIGLEIKDKVILDAFSGTGAVGIEAISRGARHVTFIEKNHKVAEMLRKNLKNLKLENRTRVFEADVDKMDFREKFDFIIADPPYDRIEKIPLRTFKRLAGLSKERFYLSHPGSFDPHAVEAELISTKAYAGARISTFRADEATGSLEK